MIKATLVVEDTVAGSSAAKYKKLKTLSVTEDGELMIDYVDQDGREKQTFYADKEWSGFNLERKDACLCEFPCECGTKSQTG